MAQELRLKTNHNPSIFNKDMLLGGLLGALVPASLPGGFVLTTAAIIGGALTGGAIGRHTQEVENREGKRVGEPSFWNKDTLLGGLIGNTIGAAVGVAAFFTIAAAGAPLVGAAVLAASWIGGATLGTMIGGKSGKSRQAAEFEMAKRQQIGAHISQSVSPEIGQAVEYTMEHNKSWAKDVLEQKLLAATQEPVRQ